MLAPGAVLLGNPGYCFECGHEHSTGDRCLSFQFEPAYFESILTSIPGCRSGRFPIARLPPSMGLAPVIAAAELASVSNDQAWLEDVSLELAGQVTSMLAGQDQQSFIPTYRDEQRIAGALRRIEQAFDQPLTIAELAENVCMSRYHFVRTFRRIVGLTPHQFILRTRLHKASIEIGRTARPILDIALEAGFADLSTFNHRFRTTMGTTPTNFRRRRQRR